MPALARRRRRGPLHQRTGATTSAPSTARWRVCKEAFPGVAVHAYTATATERVRRRHRRAAAACSSREMLVGSFDRPNLIYRVRARARRAVARSARSRPARGESGIVYCIRRKDVDETVARLAGARLSRRSRTTPA